jgi:hypothetical protein
MNTDSYDDVDKLRSRAYAGMIAMSSLRSVADKVDYIVDNFGVDFLKRHLVDIVLDYDSHDRDL